VRPMVLTRGVWFEGHYCPVKGYSNILEESGIVNGELGDEGKHFDFRSTVRPEGFEMRWELTGA